MVFNATFNNISVISWRSVLLVEETGIPREKPPICSKSLTKLYHIMLFSSTPCMSKRVGDSTNNIHLLSILLSIIV